MRRIRAAAGGLTGTLCLSAVAGLMITGCAGSGKGLDANGQPLVPGGSRGNVPLTADFESIQANIFTPICSVCHVGGGAPQGLRLDAADSYNLLVAVPSTEAPAILRVKPGDPDNSYIIQKLEGHAAVGAQMPFGGPYLSAATIAFVREWITNGAQPSASAAAPLTITVRAPEVNEFVSGTPPQIMIGFNHEIDATRIDAGSVRIEQLTRVDEQLRIEPVPARISISAANPRALMVWPSRPLTIGRYRVLMRAGSSMGVTDLAGQSIADGGANGADDSVVTTFEVETLP